MQPIDEKSWQIGPLVIMKRVFEGGQFLNNSGEVIGTAQRTQWALLMDGTMVVVAPEVADRLLDGVDGRWEKAWKSARQRIEECRAGVEQHFEGSPEAYEEVIKRLQWILNEVLTVLDPRDHHIAPNYRPWERT